MSKHTPGPWKVSDHRHRNGEETFRIEHGHVGEIVAFMESSANEADARLIAAAPELLKALERCNDALRNVHGARWFESNLGETTLAAIAKARGDA